MLLSPDTESCDVLDDRVDSIVSAASEREIPVLYCLNRRRLGKALGMTTKQSAVAVYDPSGVYDSFRRIVAVAAQGRTLPANIVDIHDTSDSGDFTDTIAPEATSNDPAN